MIALALLLCGAALPAVDRISVEVERVDGDVLCSVRADEAYAIDVVIELAERLERPVDGFDLLERAGAVSVDLRRRPVDQTLAYVLGACGLRGRLTSTALVVQADCDSDTPVETLEDAAELAYLRALRRFPRSDDAARTELVMARIQERRGNPAAARGHYELLVQEHPDSELVPYALLRSATLLYELERWSEAYEEYSNLLNLDVEHPYGVQARLALARISVELGDPQRGLYVIDALDQVLPATEPGDLADRLRIRAVCVERLGRPMDALRLVDQIERLDGPDAETREVRAEALEDLGETGEAIRAWLAVAQDLKGDHLERAYDHAARLSFELGDDLGVLFVVRQAETRAASGRAERWVARARDRMGLAAEGLSGSTLDAQLEHAETLEREGLHDQALEAARLALSSGVGLESEQRLRAVETYARAADALDRLDEGLAVLRQTLDVVEDPELRKRIYLLGAELYEGRGRFDEAIDAYQGRL